MTEGAALDLFPAHFPCTLSLHTWDLLHIVSQFSAEKGDALGIATPFATHGASRRRLGSPVGLWRERRAATPAATTSNPSSSIDQRKSWDERDRECP